MNASRFVQDEDGQDLTEFALLLAFVVIGAASIFLGMPTSMASIWRTVKGILDDVADVL